MLCPCQSGSSFADCCAAFIEGRANPANAQQLMRSRYSAYVLHEIDYLAQTWHPDYRPADLEPDRSLTWLGLTVMDHAEQQDRASVEFEARYLVGDRVDAIHESSSFLHEKGRWWYTRGKLLPPTFKPWKVSRNTVCPCGSGRKFKRCCAVQGMR